MPNRMATHGAGSHAAQTQVRKTAQQLARRYWWLLATVAVLATIDQAVVQPLLIRLSVHAPVINVSGRQRMLSQRLAKTALALEATNDGPQAEAQRRALRAIAAEWSRAHHKLKADHADLRHPAADAARIAAEFDRLQPHFTAMHAAANQLARFPAQASARSHEPASAATDPSASRLAVILAHEAEYLPIMDGIVRLYERAAQRHVARLRRVGLSIMITIWLLLLALGLFVLRPASQIIEQQLTWLADSEVRLRQARDELEIRVAQRTHDLELRSRALQQEIAERRRAEAKLREISAQLAHASRVTALGQLATGLAHELNQPLSAITNYAETADLLLDEPQSERATIQNALRCVRETALRAGKLVERMRRFVRPTPLQRQRATMESLVREVCELCQAGVRDKLYIRVDVEPNLPPVLVDTIQIQQVLMNLIQNALQAAHGTSVEHPECTVRVVQDDQQCRVEVHDNGPGLPDDLADTDFAPFYTTKPHGLGMGLAISRSIVQQHGGQLWATSAAGRGAVVSFALPLAKVSHQDIEHAADGICR